MTWNLLHLLAWAFGLVAARDLERETARRSARLLTWAIANCLLMELALLGALRFDALRLLSPLAGILAAALLGRALSALAGELDGRASGARPPTARTLAAATAATALSALAVAVLAPRSVTAAAGLAQLVEGALWLAVSLAGLALLATRRFRTPVAAAHGPAGLAAALLFGLAAAAATPLALATGIEIGAAARELVGTLFVLTLVTTLYGTLLRVRGRKLAAARERLADAQRQLATVEKLLAVGTLAAGAAHDFNNSLSVVLGHVELARDDEALAAPTLLHLDRIERAARDATAIASRLLGLARRQSPASYGSLREAVEAPLDLLAGEWKRRGITVDRRLAPIDAAPEIDLALVSQVCLNLYLNARDALVAKGGGELVVELGAAEGGVELRVRDTGVGIPEAFRERLFQPLATTKGERGTGLGLATSRAVLAAMGGAIDCDSVEGAGATFVVRLPGRADARSAVAANFRTTARSSNEPLPSRAEGERAALPRAS